MSRDFIVENDYAAAVRSDLNSVLAVIDSLIVSNIVDFGNDLSFAISTIGASDWELLIDRPIFVGADLTSPANVTLRFTRRGMLVILGATVLTINGRIEAGNHQIFSFPSTGSVVISGSERVVAEWFIPSDAVDHTAYIKKAVDSGNAAGTERPPVILTRPSYVVNNLTFSGASYVGLNLVGKPGGGTSGCVKFVVSGTNDGLVVVNNPVESNVENISFYKASYPGDDSGDYALKVHNSRFRFSNIRATNFGGGVLRITDSYLGAFYNLYGRDCYRGIHFYYDGAGEDWACTTIDFFNLFLYGCKIPFYSNQGRVHCNIYGFKSDDAGFSSSFYFDVSGHDNVINVFGGWFEGLPAWGYFVRHRGAVTVPTSNRITLHRCFISIDSWSKLWTYTDTGKGFLELKDCDLWLSGSQSSIPGRSQTVIVNGVSEHVILRGPDDLTDSTMFVVGSDSALTPYWTAGAYSMAFVNDGVASFGGKVSHRLIDHAVQGMNYEYAIDCFISDVRGLTSPALKLMRNYIYGSRISNSTMIPTAGTCNISLTNSRTVTSVTNSGSFSRGDYIRIAGAGPAGAHLDTYIVQIEWDNSAFYIKDAASTAVTGAAITLHAIRGDVKVNLHAEVGTPSAWVCVASGSPGGTWVVAGQAGYRTKAGAPDQTPYFIGEELLDTQNGKWYKSKGLTSGDWVALN